MTAELDGSAPTSRYGVLGTELPWGGETVAGVSLRGRRGLAELLRRPGDLAVEERAAVAAYLVERFPPTG